MIVFENVLELGAPPGGDEGDGAASFVLLLLAFRASSLRHQCVTKFMNIIILNENKRKLHKIYLKRIFLQLAKIQCVQEKLCFLTIHCNSYLAYIAVKDLQSSHRNASVQSLLLAGNFLYNQ